METRAFSSPYYHNQIYLTKCKSQSLNLLRPHYKTQSTFLTLLNDKPYYINPILSSNNPFIYKHEINDPNLLISDIINDNAQQEKTLKTPLGLILDAISNCLKSLKSPVIAAVLACVIMIMHGNAYPAWGSSGGCMGGSSYSDSSSSSSTSSDYSSYSSSSSDYGSSSSYGYSRNSASRQSNQMTEEEVSQFLTNMVIFTAFAFAMIAIWMVYHDRQLTARETNSIVKLQVGVLGTARSLQSELNKIALTADTSTPEGINYVLTETIRALLQHPDYFISAYAGVITKTRLADGGELFQQLSVEERGKFDEETLVNLNNIKKQIKRNAKPTQITNEFIVITILAGIKGVLELPTIKGSVELKEALQKLGSIPYQETIAAEVLWTPQEENDTLTKKQLLKDYPLLKPLEDYAQT